MFVNQPVEDVSRVMDFVGLDMAQLHGEESPEYCRLLNRRVIKAIGLENGTLPAVGAFDSDTLILLDAHDPLQRGGTGRTVNWDAAREIVASRKTILAGGLNPDNVAHAVAAVRPFGIDVSSGVESAPGLKDPVRLRRFFEALHD